MQQRHKIVVKGLFKIHQHRALVNDYVVIDSTRWHHLLADGDDFKVEEVKEGKEGLIMRGVDTTPFVVIIASLPNFK